MRVFSALIKREILDNKNGYILVPLILAAISLLLVIFSALGFASFSMTGAGGQKFSSLSSVIQSGLATSPEKIPMVIAASYWLFGALPWIALPFVIFFSLLGSLYEERRDRSILFWKSMPVSDAKEILARFVTPVFIGPLIFMAVILALQLATAIVQSLAMLPQDIPVSTMWPLAQMAEGWLTAIVYYLLWVLWALPVLAWVLLVSSFASRMPFVWAILPPFVLIVVERLFFGSNYGYQWLSLHLGDWKTDLFQGAISDFKGSMDTSISLFPSLIWQGIGISFSSLQFWLGLVIAAGLLFAAAEFRKRFS
jgi:ABC-2 type transport system permease protein